jgi:hypothetical protein
MKRALVMSIVVLLATGLVAKTKKDVPPAYVPPPQYSVMTTPPGARVYITDALGTIPIGDTPLTFNPHSTGTITLKLAGYKTVGATYSRATGSFTVQLELDPTYKPPVVEARTPQHPWEEPQIMTCNGGTTASCVAYVPRRVPQHPWEARQGSQSNGLARVRAESEAADAASAAGDNAGMMRHLYNMAEAVQVQEAADQQTIQDVLDSMPNP